MRRITIPITALAILIIPAAAWARTPLTGGLKQTVVQSVAKTDHFDIGSRQVSACFGGYTDGRYAIVGGGLNSQRHPSWYQANGLCDIKIKFQGQFVSWQPDAAILRHESGNWKMLVQFDEITAGELERHGVPVSVYENLTGGIGPYPNNNE